ncbi:actin interacting protein 3-domain-containing protein [Irpex rosettiformis]|uniref:Actin interacting protein 3-domain-containing protein n=1 Tax=Irpex rosettiformis TaxID=378272 RepID=A0ACB8TUW4_9APHY|nr:actin interacting protein 3-domain-containing protein [Irpex rosettiformis]
MSSTARQSSHSSRRDIQSSSSTASHARSDRSSRPQQNPAIESAVTRLLVSIKALLETLTSWSAGKKSEVDVSDIYVKLGNDFNAAVSAFGTFRIDMTELNAIPDELRGVLESCLAEDACQQTLDLYLPDVRKIITKLLQGLRAKQSIYREIVSDQRSRSSVAEDGSVVSSRPESRSSRTSRRDTANSTRSSTRDNTASSDSYSRRSAVSTRRKESVNSNPPETFIGGFAVGAAAPEAHRSSTPAQPQPKRDWPEGSGPRPPSRTSATTSADVRGEQVAPPPEVPPVPRPPSQVPSHVKRYSLVDRPVSSPTPPPTAPTPPPPPAVVIEPTSPNGTETPLDEPPTFVESPPPDGPAVQSSLAALKHSDALERRASKRFSTYNISKMTGGTLRGVAGPSNRRSMAFSSAPTPGDLAALTKEGEEEPVARKRDKPRSGQQWPRGPSPIAEDEEEAPPVPPLPASARGPSPHSAIVQKPELSTILPPPPIPLDETRATTPTSAFPVFLQVGREVKKVMMEPSLSFSSLRVLFVDKFSYSPGQDNFPAIYIRDPSSGVQYELEDMDEVKEKCLLSLNIEPLDQIKQHIDLQISALSKDIKDLRGAVSSQRRNSLPPSGPVIIGQPLSEAPSQAPRPSDRQFRNIARRLSRMIPESGDEENTPRVTPEPVMPQTTGVSIQPQMTGASIMSDYSARVVSDLKTQFDEVQNLRRDLGIMRQLYTDFMSQTKESLGALRAQTQNVKELASVKVGGARAYISDGKAKLDSRSQNVLTKMEELQDTVEAIKDDVLKRNVSPRPQLLKNVKADIASASAELESLKDHIQTIKPMWKKTWEEELQNIVEEQQFLSHQEEFLNDLLEDYKAVIEVYGHVEKVISLRGSGSGKARGGKVFRPPPPDEGHTGLSTVLLELRGNADGGDRRMKAIEATEKNRVKQMQNRSDEFQNELSGFVKDKKLKMTGGAEEVERVRQKRNDMTLKAMFTGGSGTSSGVASPSLSANGDLA